jgi:hypothetical protein
LDVDDVEVHTRFVELATACGAHALLEHLVCEETPGGGRHYGYLCVAWAGSTILARRPVGLKAHGRERFETLIEVKGEGGQCVVAPTPAGVHPDHPERGYTMVHGDWTRVPLISPKARRVLRACARALDEAVPRAEDGSTLVRARPKHPSHSASLPLSPKNTSKRYA